MAMISKKKAPHSPAIPRAEAIAGKPKRKTIKFGSVTIAADVPSPSIVKQNVEWGQMVLKRAATKLGRPGIKIRSAKDVPFFHLDEDQPDTFIRVLNGKHERGTFSNGRFKATG